MNGSTRTAREMMGEGLREMGVLTIVFYGLSAFIKFGATASGVLGGAVAVSVGTRAVAHRRPPGERDMELIERTVFGMGPVFAVLIIWLTPIVHRRARERAERRRQADARKTGSH
jgi:membrane protein YqaA with SNARE-associated domain